MSGRPTTYRRSCIGFLALLGLLPTGQAAPEVDGEQAVFALTALKDSRERLIAGIVRASGRAQSGDYLRTIDFYNAFDVPAGNYRIDQTETVLNGPNDPALLRGVTIRYARNEKSSTFSKARSSVTIDRPERQPDPAFKTFDVRAIGILLYADFSLGTSFEELISHLMSQEITGFNRDAVGLCKITWEFGESRELQRMLWLDASRGYSPVRQETRYRKSEQDAWSGVKILSETTWREIDGAWVPQTYVLEDRFNVRVKKYELAFDWESINEPVPEEVFSWEGFDLPIGTAIVDNRLGTPIQLGQVGGFVGPTEAEAESITRTRIVIVVAALSVGVILLSAFLRWRRERNKA